MRHFYVWRLWSLAFVLAVPITPYAETLSNFVGRHLSEVKAEAEAKDIVFVTQRVDSPERRGEILLQIPGGGSEIGTNRMVFLKVSDGAMAPDLRGLSEADAKNRARHHGIHSEVTRDLHASVPEGMVADQIPEAGARIDASRQIVFLEVSDGGIKIPELKNESHYDALRILSDLGLNGRIEPPDFVSNSGGECGVIFYYGSRVTASNPASGSTVKTGTQIVLRYETFVKSTWREQCDDHGRVR